MAAVRIKACGFKVLFCKVVAKFCPGIMTGNEDGAVFFAIRQGEKNSEVKIHCQIELWHWATRIYLRPHNHA